MKDDYPERQEGILALVVLAAVYASMGLFVRYLNTGFLVFQQVYLRVFAAFFLGLICFNKGLDFSKLRKISQKEWLLLIFRSAAIYLFGVTLFTKAINIAKFSNVSFVGSIPITPILAVLLLKEKLTWKKVLLILTAFLGVILIAVKDYSQIFIWGKGELITLISTFFFSAGYVTRKLHSDLLNNKEIVQIMFFLSFIMLFTVSLIKGDGLPINNWHSGLLLVVLGAGLFNVINNFLQNYGFQKIEAILAGNILTLQSVFAVLLGFLFYRELPNLKELLGGATIITSVIAMNKVEEIE